MADAAVQSATERYALVTGANKGIGFEICRQLASKGIVVILASRDEKRGVEAQEKLKEFDNHVVYRQLDVVDPASVAAAAEFIKNKFGRLDILVNNAGILGVDVEGDESVLVEFLEAEVASIRAGGQIQAEAFHPKESGRVIETVKGAEDCFQTNYYGVKRVTEAFIPLLQLSHSPRIVNVSSGAGSLVCQPNEWVRGVMSDEEGLTEGRVDEVVQKFLNSLREGSVEENQWPRHLVAYKLSKAALNAYTRLTAKRNPSILVNSVCPGYCRTDITANSGPLTAVEGAEVAVKLALLPHGGPSGSFFLRDQALSLSIY